jgi:hypothetical protein
MQISDQVKMSEAFFIEKSQIKDIYLKTKLLLCIVYRKKCLQRQDGCQCCDVFCGFVSK